MTISSKIDLAVQCNAVNISTGFGFVELNKLRPKSTWMRKWSRTGLIQEKKNKIKKQGKEIYPVSYQCL